MGFFYKELASFVKCLLHCSTFSRPNAGTPALTNIIYYKITVKMQFRLALVTECSIFSRKCQILSVHFCGNAIR